MDTQTAVQFVADHHHAVLATRRSNGEVQQSPVLAVAHQGRVLVSTRETAMKVRHLRRDPRAWLCVLPDTFFGTWVQISGPVQILSLPEGMDLLVQYYRLANGEHEDWADYRAAMQREQRCIVAITPEHVGPTISG